jgi:hypothetical protein
MLTTHEVKKAELVGTTRTTITGNRIYIKLPNEWTEKNVSEDNLVICEYTDKSIIVKKYEKDFFNKYILA